ncbi:MULTISPECIES: flagellar hook capping FlgD N-terminal domain-containing protein [Arthrobacter]|uniref:Flagellar hook capping FlgD N-terminal domain-containing protein n=2 Tax=Arthrobacter TaxID=1663 RepID=A0ABU9KIF2_9MICC|nr:flagellar hook capping FlgD N-terminal domain-containing protein [Arthrobacter sp. YJM1]MDP5226337.1 flagellar hook capping FlgD N-terminal domain-containing protein [Arthrobacter sp. YJM1]
MTISPVSTALGGTSAGTAVGFTSLSSAAPTRAPKQAMDSTVFMDLLVTQLKNQDPSSPMDTNAMIGQTTQLAMMEKLTQLASDSATGLSVQQRAAAAALIGKAVTYLAADGTSGGGTVSSVSYSGSTPTVTVGGASILLGSITGVTGA